MAKKINKSAMESLLGSLSGKPDVQEDDTSQETFEDTSEPQKSDEETSRPVTRQYVRRTGEEVRICTIIDKTLFEKVKVLSQTEGITVRSIIEYMLGKAVENYESKYGRLKVRKSHKGDIGDVLG